jgi:hypothetical protein
MNRSIKRLRSRSRPRPGPDAEVGERCRFSSAILPP